MQIMQDAQQRAEFIHQKHASHNSGIMKWNANMSSSWMFLRCCVHKLVLQDLIISGCQLKYFIPFMQVIHDFSETKNHG